MDVDEIKVSITVYYKEERLIEGHYKKYLIQTVVYLDKNRFLLN